MTVVGGAEVEIRAKDAGVQKDIEKLFGGLAGPAKEFEKIVDRVTGGLGSGFTKAGATAAAGLGVLAVAAGAIKAAFTFEDVGKDIIKLQRLTGESAEQASRLRFAAQQSGVSVDTLGRSLVLLSKNVAAGKAVFTEYGIATVDATGKSLPLNDVLLNIADKYTHLEDPIKRTALAQEAFGRGGKELLPFLARGRAGIEELEKATSKYGLVLTTANLVTVKAAIQAQREQSAAFQGLQVQIGAQVLPALTSLERGATQALLVVMPAAAKVIGLTVVPVFEGLAHVVNFGSDALAEHTTAAKVLAGVAAAAVVPALVSWAAAQAVVLAESVVLDLTLGSRAALLFAERLGILTLAEDSYAVSVSVANAATLGLAGAVVLASTRIVQSSTDAKKWADSLTSAAAAPQENIDKLQAKINELQRDPGQGKGFLAQFFSAKTAGEDSYQKLFAAQAKIQEIKKAAAEQDKAGQDAASNLEDQFTKEGLTLDDLGTKTGFTKDQIEILATSMKIDLAKATQEQSDALENQARRLGITSQAALKLADDNAVLTDFTKDATAKTTAFADALAQTVGSKIASQQADQALESAQRALQNVQKDNADKQLAANRNVEQTIRSLTAATNARADAEAALQAILHPTARTKEEADLGLSDARIGQERAAIAVTDAEARLRTLREGDSSGKVGTPEQIRQGELDVADARNNVVRASERAADAQAKVNALTPAGIRGSKEYRDAQGHLSDTTQGVADAQDAVKRAQADAKAVADDTAGRAADLASKTAAVASAAVDQANATYRLTGSQEAAFGVLDRYSAYLRDTLGSLGQTPGAIDAIIGRLGLLQDKYHIVAGDKASILNAIGSDFGPLPATAGTGGRRLPGFSDGGYVPGALGAPQRIVAHGGEFVLSRDMLAGRTPIPPSASTATPVEQHAHVHVESGVDPSIVAQAEQGARIVTWFLPSSGRR